MAWTYRSISGMSSHALVLDWNDSHTLVGSEGGEAPSWIASSTSEGARGKDSSSGTFDVGIGGRIGGGLGCLGCGNTRVALGALASQGKIAFGFTGSGAFWGTSYHMSFGASG